MLFSPPNFPAAASVCRPRTNPRSTPLETSDKITQLENEIKVLKNEVQAVLLDIRENVLNAENPFSTPKPAVTSHQTIIDHQSQMNTPQPVTEAKSTPTPAPAPAPAPAVPPVSSPAPPVQEQKPITVHPDETHAHEAGETDRKNNVRKPAKTCETEPKNNKKKTAETTCEDISQTEPFEEQFEIEPPRFEISKSRSPKGQPDLVAYAGLACWVEDSTRRLGKERTQALLEISETAGLLPPDVREILTKLTTIKSTEHSYKPTARDYFDSLVKIAALFGNNSNYNAALLLVLAQGDVHG